MRKKYSSAAANFIFTVQKVCGHCVIAQRVSLGRGIHMNTDADSRITPCLDHYTHPQSQSAYAYAYIWVNITAPLTKGTKKAHSGHFLSMSMLQTDRQPDRRTAGQLGPPNKQKQEAWLPQICAGLRRRALTWVWLSATSWVLGLGLGIGHWLPLACRY